MARIELRHCTVRLEDGLSGTAANNQPVTPPISGDTTLTLASVALNTDVTDKVPLGARFTIAGESGSPTHVVTARTPSSSNPTTQITFTPALGSGTYTSAAAGIAGAATTTQQGSGIQNEIQQIARYANNVTGGTFTLTLTINGGGPVTTGAIAYNANATAIQTAIDLVSGVTAGHIVVTGGPLTTSAITITFSGADVDLTNQGQTTIDGSSLTASIGNKTLTFSPQQLDIKIGDGDLKYTENDDFKYDLDRGNLDTVRQGDEKPMDVSLSFVYEHITTGTGEAVAPMDALKRRGGAAEWVSSATDKCEPYAVDLSVIHTPPCGTAQIETTLFPDFRSDKREPSLKDSLIQITGRCNAVEPVVSRG